MANEMEAAAKIVDSLKDTKTGKAFDETVSLLPRTINAILTPYRKWLITSETNFEKTSELLSSRMMNVPKEKIQAAEPYIMVPALQAISYSMDSEELRNMYANLLASAMNTDTAASVHPAFVEIIKQMSPQDTYVLKEISKGKARAFINPMQKVEKGGLYIFKYFTDLSIDHKNPFSISICITNLNRLGILTIHESVTHSELKIYSTLEDAIYRTKQSGMLLLEKYQKDLIHFQQGSIDVSPLGANFIHVCL